MKIGIIFDNRPRPETTGLYCRRALARMADVEHLLPDELDQIPPGLFDVFVVVDDGLDYPIPDHIRPRVAWAIDTHMDFERTVSRFGNADFLFAAQKNGALQLQTVLRREVRWLPLACDPEIHRLIPQQAPRSSIAFVGHFLSGQRRELLSLLASQFADTWFGQALFDEMAQVYCRARVGFNCSVADDLNMRLFEIPCFGIPLVTNAIDGNGLEELFTPGRDLLVYHDANELVALVTQLLGDPQLCQRIGMAGRQRVLQSHTYEHRMRDLLAVVQRTPPPLVSASSSSKSHSYFEFSRPEVQDLVPRTARLILDIGCGGGRLGEELRESRGCQVTGIEADPTAAALAGRRLDHVVQGSVEELPVTEFRPGTFDCIVLADVLEHLRHPERVLAKCREWLAADGTLVISIPNSRHHSVVSGLIRGNWTYEPAGLLDDDHVRCFTRRELEKLLFRTGFTVVSMHVVPGNGYSEWMQTGRPGEVHFDALQMSGLAPEEAEEFFVYQYLFQAQPAARREFGLTSIVIVTFNQFPYTKECVDSIQSKTNEPYELIFVDNASTDGTLEYLRTIPNARVIANSENRGFAPAVNQGLAICRGENILLLNNDVVVTTGWLSGLLEALHDHPSNGLVGPQSNCVSGDQQIEVSYTDLTSLDGFAWDRRRNRQLIATDRLVGFCLLFRRAVMERIGLLDEQFRIGCFEDDDFCRRAHQAGYRALIATGVFVHHYGSASFRGAGINLAQLLAENEERFQKKWATADLDLACANTTLAEQSLTTRYQLIELADEGPLLRRQTIRLSLCMIVRDNEETIAACLDSIYPWVDEIIVVDTGSKDRTPEICRRFGARMYQFPWCDDFSAARNESIKHATGDWVFWMDSDDTIPHDQGLRLRSLVYGPHAIDTLGYVMQVQCRSAEPEQMTVVDHVKVFRNHLQLRFEHRIHEQILPAIRRANGSVEFSDIHVVHSGSDPTPEIRERKLERDYRILKLDLMDRPDHPFVLFNLGMTYDDDGQYVEAVRCLRRCLEVSGSGESHLSKAYSLLVNSLRGLGRAEDAIQTTNEALSLFPGDKELLFRRGCLCLDTSRYAAAARDFEQVLTEHQDRTFRSFDPAIAGFKARHNLAIAYQQLGLAEQATREWLLVIQNSPRFGLGWLCLVKHYLSGGHSTSAEELACRMRRKVGFTVETAIAESVCQEARGDLGAAHVTLENAFACTKDASCLDELARILTESGQLAESIPVLQRLQELQPHNPTVLHNLGVALHLEGQTNTAKETLRRCLEIDPNRTLSICQLATIHQDLGDQSVALELLTKALVLHPDHPELRSAWLRISSNSQSPV